MKTAQIFFPVFAFILAVAAAGLRGAESITDVKIDIPYKKFVLKNGLTLIVHEDRKAPIVAVNLWYHVGSKNEKVGKTGFAHLFEHLMFTGSEHFKGGGDQRAFFEVMEQAKLDTQRGVVQNEKRQGENQPYGVARELITKGTAPMGHPYSWTTIGSMEDLNAASLEDVKTWFRTYYGAANVVLVIAGDVQPEEVHKKVEHYFGDIGSGPVLKRSEAWVARMSGEKRASLQDRVPQSRIYKTWNIPGYNT